MRIATWNVNSIRTRHQRHLAWLDRFRPDVLCLQELKVVEDDFPFDALAERGYHAAVLGQKGYNGVAIVARERPERVRRGFDDGADEDPQARLIAATVSGVRVVSAYFPNGQRVGSDKYDYKLAWLERLRGYLDRHVSPDDSFALCGDFNIAADERDVSQPQKWWGTVLYNEEMAAAFRRLADWGLVDCFRRLHDEEGRYSWWDYRRLAFPKNNGLRIDYVMATAPLAERLRAAAMDRDQRKPSTCPEGTKPSDHVPVYADFA